MSTTIIPGSPEAVSIGINMLARELSFEINTGMKMSRHYSTIQTARSLGFTGRTKKQALEYVVDALGAAVNPRITKALGR